MAPNKSEKDLFCQTMESEERKRGIRSFVIREGRMTDAQHKAFDRLWPEYGIDQLSDLAEVTDFSQVSLDIGFGNGESLIHAAQVESDTLHIGVEVHRPGIGNVLLGIEKNKLKNVRIIHADAAQFIKLIPDNFIHRALIFFPDPWPKKRHHKRRLIQPHFIEALYPKIKRHGILHLATDWQPYAEHMLEVITKVNRENTCPLKNIALKLRDVQSQSDDPEVITNIIASGHNDPETEESICCIDENITNTDIPGQFPFVSRPPYRPMTKYERRGVKLGHEVFDIIYQKS